MKDDQVAISNALKQQRYRERYRNYRKRAEQLETTAMEALAAAVLCLADVNDPRYRQPAASVILSATEELFEEIEFRAVISKVKARIDATNSNAD